MYVAFAFGGQSRELAQAVWRDRQFDPLDRFSAGEAGRQSRESYIACLLRWGCIYWDGRHVEWAPASKHLSEPLTDKQVEALSNV